MDLPTFEIRRATLEDLEILWDDNIALHPLDIRWKQWKKEYISYHQTGLASTYVILCNQYPIGEGTLLFSNECHAVYHRLDLADGKNIANVNALRIQKQYENQGHISKLVHFMELEAKKMGYQALSIGVEPQQTRNLAIYLHFGFTTFITSEVEDSALILYYKKTLQEPN